MAKPNNQLPDQATIERYYGTMEAYLEEQRRTALVDLEENTAKPVSSWNWDYARRFRVNPRFGKVSNSQKSTRSFHLFGHHN